MSLKVKETKIISKYTLNVVTCEALSLENGHIAYNESSDINGQYPVDTMASFSCSSGFSLTGSESSICQMSGHWRQQSQMCKAGKESNFYKKLH